jgi:WD40 repeat protein
VGEKDGLPFFTMKLATQGTLTARREALRGRWRDIATLVITLAEAVQHAHAHGVVHRDLKPGNVLFDEADRPYVSDFGLAKFTTAEPSVTRSCVVMGTPAYLAPEVLAEGAGAATTDSDVYGLGAILYELLAGQPPFASASIPDLLRQVAGDPPRRPSELARGVPRDLEVICLRCLEKEPAKRLPGALALAEDLQRWLEHRPIQARPVGTGERVMRWARRNPALATLSTFFLFALAGGGVALQRSNTQLRAALAQAGVAENTAQDRLHGALLDQARLLRTSGQRGQRYDTLEILARAAAIRSSPTVRNEVTAALARPDLRFERPLRAFFANELATVAFAPDLRSYLSATGQPDFALLSASDGRILRRFRSAGEGQPQTFAFNGDGRWFTALFGDGRVEVWPREGEKPVWTIPPRGRLSVARALHPSEPICAWADEAGAIQLRQLLTGDVRKLTEPGDRVVRLQFSPGGTQLAVLRWNRLVLIDATSGAARWAREGLWAAVDLAWSADDRWLAAADEARGDLLIFEAKSGAVTQALPGGGALPQLVAFVPGHRRVAVLSRNSTLRVWDVLTGDAVFQTGMPPRTLAFSPDGRQMAGARRWLEVGVFSWAEENVFREFQGGQLTKQGCDEGALSPDGRWLATSDPREVRVWDSARGEQVGVVPLNGADWTSVHFDPRGGRLLYSAMNRGLFARTLTTGPTGANGIAGLMLGDERPLGPNRDGRLLGFGANGRDWYIDRVKIERVVIWPDGDPARERSVAESRHFDRPTFSPDGKFVATMGYPLTNVRVTTVGSGQPAVLLPIKQHAGAGFSADSRWFVTGTEVEFQAWSLPELQPGPRWQRPIEGGPWGTPVFSPDGRWVGCNRSLGEIEVREARGFREQVLLIPPLRFDFASAVWSRDGERLFLLGAGHRVFEWNLAALRRELAARGLDW